MRQQLRYRHHQQLLRHIKSLTTPTITMIATTTKLHNNNKNKPTNSTTTKINQPTQQQHLFFNRSSLSTLFSLGLTLKSVG